MEKIEVPRAGLALSRIGLGTWAIGGWMWGGVDHGEAVETIRSAVDRGVTLIDTAPVYGFGQSEEIVGEALAKGGLRARAQIATKAGLGWRDGKPYRDARAFSLRQELEGSLRRLRTDVIDLYQVHWPDPNTPAEETAETLAGFLKEGKIRAIGVSNFSPQQMAAFAAVAPLHTVQPPYNLFERGIEDDVLPYANGNGLVSLCYGALCRGLLSGKVTVDRAFTGDDLRKVDPKFSAANLPRYVAAVQALDELARTRFGKPVLALAVRWILDRGATVALWGARRPDQLDGVEAIDGWSIDAQTMADIDAILAAHVPNPIGPEFMAPPVRTPEAA
jgi:aryl-alcohol dehydrogenase-like predicted oxidoreductase